MQRSWKKVAQKRPEGIGKLALFLEQAEVSVCRRPRPRGIMSEEWVVQDPYTLWVDKEKRFILYPVESC